MRQYKLDKKAKFMEIKSIKPKKQSEIAKEMAISTSTLQRYRRERKMHSPYRIIQSSKTHTRKQKVSNNTDHDLKMTWKEFVKYKKNKLKGGNPNDDNSSRGRDLIEQAFSS